MGNDDAIRCDACPVLCYIKPGRTGSCDRYANHDGKLVRLDPHVLLDQAVSRGESVVPFLEHSQDWNGNLVDQAGTFVTAIGAGTTYPDYKPAPFIISSSINAVDMVTVVTEGIFSYCGVKVKIDTDRYLGPETNTVRAQGEAVGHVTTSEYGSQMLSLGNIPCGSWTVVMPQIWLGRRPNAVASIDTVAALAQADVTGDLSYVSTAGGAFLEWLEGRELPGVAALARR